MVRKIGLYLLTAVAMLCFATSDSNAQSISTRHVREATRSGEAKPVGQLSSERIMNLDIVLNLRDRAGLQDFLVELYDPSSPSYRKYLTPQEFTAKF